MNEQEAQQIVIAYLVEHFDVPAEKVTLQANLFEELELDSIDALDMVGLLESRLKVAVNDEELKKIRTVEDVVGYLLRNAPKDLGHA